MLPNLRVRSEALELMDDQSIGGAELEEALRQLRLINWVLGAAWPTIEGVVRLWAAAGRPTRLSLLDVGAGSGEVARLLLRWAAWRGVSLHIILLDIHPQTCAVAARLFRDEPRVSVVCGDLLRLPPRGADIVMASLFLHHIATAQLPMVLTAMQRAARVGVVVNDLHRHPIAWLAIRAATALLSRNRMIRHDAPLSVWRGFSAADLAALRAAPSLAGLQYSWRPLFRWLILLKQAEW